MNVSMSKSGTVNIAALDGRLDIETAPAVKEQLLKQIEAEAAPLLLDLSKLTYCSSMGLRVLIELAKAQRAKEAGFGMYGLPEYVAELFDVAGMLRILNVYDDQEAAMEAVGG